MKNLILIAMIGTFFISCKNDSSQKTPEKLNYPLTKKVDTVTNYFGIMVKDPYRWLEDDMSEETKKTEEQVDAPKVEKTETPVAKVEKTEAPVVEEAKKEVEEVLANVQIQLDRGLTALKWCPADALEHIDTAAELKNIVARVEAVRNYVGDDIDLCLDFHGRFSMAMSRRVFPLLEPYNLMFIEEPVLPEYTDHFGLVVQSTSIPIATGERLFSRGDFKDVLRSGIAVAQPDLSHAGGISETRRIAAMAETYDVSMAPHCPLGPIALAACLQLDFATPNFLVQEQILGLGKGNDGDLMKYIADFSVFDAPDGYIELMTKPGLGIEVDEKAVREASVKGHRGRAPEWHHKDGSFAEW